MYNLVKDYKYIHFSNKKLPYFCSILKFKSYFMTKIKGTLIPIGGNEDIGLEAYDM